MSHINGRPFKNEVIRINGFFPFAHINRLPACAPFKNCLAFVCKEKERIKTGKQERGNEEERKKEKEKEGEIE